MIRIKCIILSVLFCCCIQNKDNIITVRFDDVQKIQVGTIVKYENSIIGEVSNLSVNDSGYFLVEIHLNDEFIIPSGSLFYLSERNFLGNSALLIDVSNVKIGKKSDYYQGVNDPKYSEKTIDYNTSQNDTIPKVVIFLDSLLRNNFD